MTVPDRRRGGPTRRDFLLLGVGALAVTTQPFAGPRRVVVRRRVPVMGTVAELAVVTGDRAAAHRAIDAAIARLHAVERAMTRFDAASDIGRVNGRAAAEAVTVAPWTAAVLAASLEWAAASDGRFDPCLLRATEAWDVGQRHAPPPAAAFRRLAGRRLYRAVDVGRWRGAPAVRLADPDAGVDLGGIAKGFGVDQAVAALRDHGIRDAIVNVGGDLYAMGSGTDGAKWRVGIRRPDQSGAMAATLDVEDAAVATSGTYLQYFESGGRRYHHLLDPATAAPRDCAMQSLTVIAADAMTADAAATAAFGAPPAEAARLVAARAAGARIALAL